MPPRSDICSLHTKRGILVLLSALILLTGCVTQYGAINRVDSSTILELTTGIVVGRVKFVVDGATMNYNILNRPAMRLYNHSDGQFYDTPQVDSNGSFSWGIPEGPYEIGVLGGGLAELTAFFPSNRRSLQGARLTSARLWICGRTGQSQIPRYTSR